MMRRPLELGLRVAGIGALLVALFLSLRTAAVPASANGAMLPAVALSDSTGITAVRELSSRIIRSARDSAWPAVATALRRVPERAVRDAFAVAAASGMSLTWADSTRALGLAVSATSSLEPQGGTTVRAAGLAMQSLVVRDDAGMLDSVPDARLGLAVRGAQLSGHAVAVQGTTRASVTIPARAPIKRVLLFAQPGWEAKFIAAALEERGWSVDGTLLIARRASVNIGAPAVLDTVRYGAAIVLDSGLVALSVLQRFVAQGGGVIFANDAVSASASRSLLPATAIESQPGVPGALLTAAPRLGLEAWMLRPTDDAVVLLSDARGSATRPTVIAARRGIGRVLVSAYRETWRWRLEGNDDGIEGHRAFWSGLVRSVTLAERSPIDTSRRDASSYPGDAAPYADVVARLGAPTATLPAISGGATLPTAPKLWLLYVIAAAGLLGEWASRRIRGAP